MHIAGRITITMSRRATPKRTLDDRAYPIRVKVLDNMPERDWLRLRDAEVWLRENVGVGNYASHAQSGYELHSRAFYFRSLDAAQRFLEAFPKYEMADTSQRLEHVRTAQEWVASGQVCRPHSTLGNLSKRPDQLAEQERDHDRTGYEPCDQKKAEL